MALLISPAFALFTNGSFEDGAFTNWTTGAFSNPGLSGSAPFSASSIIRGSGGTIRTSMVGSPGGASMSKTDPIVNKGRTTDSDLNPVLPPALLTPRFGSYAAIVNSDGISTEGTGTGNNHNATTLKQSTIVAESDRDVDGKIHIRFAYAPMLENPDHDDFEQPYFYVAVKNITQGSSLLYERFNFAGQAGVPWKEVNIRITPLPDNPEGITKWLYTDWQIVDIAPDPASIAVGDTIELEVIAAGCKFTDHGAYVYVDAFGSKLPGLNVVATAAATVAPGDKLTYNINYRNTDTAGFNTSLVTFNVPPQTSFFSVSNPACSQLNGVVTCNFGALAPDANGTFQVVVDVLPSAAGTVTAGNYSIAGTTSTGAAYLPLLGPIVNTTVVRPDDIEVTQSFRMNGLTNLILTITVKNNGMTPVTGAAISDTFPGAVPSTNWDWTCAGANGTNNSACGTLSGTGNLNLKTLGTLPAGGAVVFTVSGFLANWSTWENTATIAVPSGYTDTVLANNTSTIGRYQILLMIIFR